MDDIHFIQFCGIILVPAVLSVTLRHRQSAALTGGEEEQDIMVDIMLKTVAVAVCILEALVLTVTFTVQLLELSDYQNPYFPLHWDSNSFKILMVQSFFQELISEIDTEPTSMTQIHYIRSSLRHKKVVLLMMQSSVYQRELKSFLVTIWL